MNSKKSGYLIFLISLALLVLILSLGCKTRINKEYHEVVHSGISAGQQFHDVFGNDYNIQGYFKENSSDSVETGLWMFVKKDTPIVLIGSFSDGLPVKEWQFVLNDGHVFSSIWKVYTNKFNNCSFSLPFQYEETIYDSTLFKLKTRNDSLGKVSVIVKVGQSKLENEWLLANIDKNEMAGIANMGFRFITPKKHEIKTSNGTYVFTQYFMKDSVGDDVKLYHFYGSLSSTKHVVELSVWHQGPKDDLVKLIFNLIVNNLYVGDERFYNPYNVTKF